MPSIAITGGIACGKSLAMSFFKTFCEHQKKSSPRPLAELAAGDAMPEASGAQRLSIYSILDDASTGTTMQCTSAVELWKRVVFFDADKEVAQLLDHDHEVAQEITHAFGASLYNEQGKADRAQLRSLILASPQHKQQLEEILHPRLKKIWHPQAIAAQGDTTSIFIADIPLLFENSLAEYFDHVIVVAASEQVQKDRLAQQRHLSPETASALLQLQLPLTEKINRATVVLWNDGTKENLEKQFLLLLHSLFSLMSTTLEEQSLPSTRPLSKLAYADEEQGATAHRGGVYKETLDDSSTGATQLFAAEVEFGKRSPLSLNELQSLTYPQLLERHQQLELTLPHDSSRHGLIIAQARHQILSGGELTACGILEFSKENPFLRWPAFNFKPCPEDVVVPVVFLKQYALRPGLSIQGKVHILNNRRLALESITTIEGIPLEEWKTPKEFDQLTAAFPTRRLFLEQPNHTNDAARVVDLIAPLGMGQRGLIIAPPRVGKTMMLKSLALAIIANHPKVHLMLLLVDERPEEVTDLRTSLHCDIFSSTFDEPTDRHVQVSELVAERSKRLVELGQDVVILVDSITRLSRGYNNATTGKGRTMSGGVDAKGLERPKRFFGSARNVEEGGSLTIIATALVETKSKMDDLIFEEYKGTGNMEIRLDRFLADQRIFPAIHLTQSATRREELLYHPDELELITKLRRQLFELPAAEAMQILIENIEATGSNAELLMTGLRGI